MIKTAGGDKSIWKDVMSWLEAWKSDLDKHPGTKVLLGAGAGALGGNVLSRMAGKDKDHGKNTAVGALLGALAAGADNDRVNSRRLEGGQDGLAMLTAMRNVGKFPTYPKGFMDSARLGVTDADFHKAMGWGK
jgi:hypothetical protein